MAMAQAPAQNDAAPIASLDGAVAREVSAPASDPADVSDEDLNALSERMVKDFTEWTTLSSGQRDIVERRMNAFARQQQEESQDAFTPAADAALNVLIARITKAHAEWIALNRKQQQIVVRKNAAKMNAAVIEKQPEEPQADVSDPYLKALIVRITKAHVEWIALDSLVQQFTVDFTVGRRVDAAAGRKLKELQGPTMTPPDEHLNELIASMTKIELELAVLNPKQQQIVVSRIPAIESLRYGIETSLAQAMPAADATAQAAASQVVAQNESVKYIRGMK